MTLWPRTLSLRLAFMFSLVSVLLLGAVGFYLYQSLQREITWRDDQALLGRVQRMQALITDSDSIDTLRRRPQLYENMLGNRDNVLWIVDDAGQLLIDVNPLALPVPELPPASSPQLGDSPGDKSLRLAWFDVPSSGRHLTLIAGKLVNEREQMLGAYRMKIWIALLVGAVLAFLLGWMVSQRGLRPVRQLATRAASIDVQHLHLRLQAFKDVNELSTLSHALNQMLARLEDGFAQLTRFSEDLAHEMRTPLSNLMGQTQQTLGRSRSPEVYQELLVSNQEEYERLARMIDSMLFLARTEQPKASINRQQIDLHALVAQLCDYFEGMGEDRGIELINQSQGTLNADPELLRRALANLIANALRYATSNTPVTIGSTLSSGGLEVYVHNIGEPIGAEHLPHLFERFYRCDPSRNQPGDSGGLGLAIVRSIMQAHGGQVSVTSDSTGTVFTLFLPA
ncbi:heavy metal sensor histidine kinase [Pseudomonas folii]|uniref:Sensor protein n=1 Tax=Pseudomonas folii TaxID=2762593 RepID=A0ABR7B3K0_9PSED|nr:heavy metal sensor histidine kinase [Pseudomonas folii]MBC3951762.1 heavy metal sensor histidine kinase [Pseudomonas folii]